MNKVTEPWFPAHLELVVVVAEKTTALTGETGVVIACDDRKRHVCVDMIAADIVPNPLWFHLDEIAPA